MTTVLLETTMGGVRIELFDAAMPGTTKNFRTLVAKGFYDGTVFHRVIAGFMVQGGDPQGTGSGGPGYAIKDELPPTNRNARGTIAMANAGPDTGGSQFFLNVVDNARLDRKHPPSGRSWRAWTSWTRSARRRRTRGTAQRRRSRSARRPSCRRGEAPAVRKRHPFAGSAACSPPSRLKAGTTISCTIDGTRGTSVARGDVVCTGSVRVDGKEVPHSKLGTRSGHPRVRMPRIANRPDAPVAGRVPSWTGAKQPLCIRVNST